jgi:predicted regulator of Ras-like GTPase activity (Roadblock/LC7/MglB family)
MSAIALSQAQGEMLTKVLAGLASECDARVAVISDVGGNIMAQAPASPDLAVETAAVLAAGTFLATRELADVVGETGFQSSCHRGANSGVLVHALGDHHLVLLVLSSKSVEGLARICLEKVSVQLISMLESAGGQSVMDAGQVSDFEVEEIG